MRTRETVKGQAVKKGQATATKDPQPSRKRIEFTLHAPEAHNVFVAGTFNDWNPTDRLMTRNAEGIWKARIIVPPGVHQYRFVVDGEWRDDPGCPDRIPNDHGGQNCVITVHE
ncbi:MAG: glycogen-binding domain-containing protein [Syntrophorhabdales bacterium]|jgi:1,4-alpha-glucan branching enzyme